MYFNYKDQINDSPRKRNGYSWSRWRKTEPDGNNMYPNHSPLWNALINVAYYLSPSQCYKPIRLIRSLVRSAQQCCSHRTTHAAPFETRARARQSATDSGQVQVRGSGVSWTSQTHALARVLRHPSAIACRRRLPSEIANNDTDTAAHHTNRANYTCDDALERGRGLILQLDVSACVCVFCDGGGAMSLSPSQIIT